MASSPLGDFLRRSRDQVSPADAGIRSTGARRVAGLRREEVAMLAGVSVDYYVRLEQGRERTPSAQMLDALSGALLLGEDARMHLFRLAGLAPRGLVDTGPEHADPSLLTLMDAWPDNPALLYGRAYDVLAANPLAEALFCGFSFSRNLMLTVFLDPAARTLYRDWPTIAAGSVAGFRLAFGAAPHHPRIRTVLTTLTEHSAEFRALWADHRARGKSMEVKSFHHPSVGETTLRMHTFDVRSAPGQELVVYHADPGTPSADALRLLASVSATR
ncbi:transcriptional regulator with XRE-family HTH domain [Catenuloplanes nepalensis]|uniref:Transcriptional regulator with XRE-family HTH domain n=1 Tax=Catenuloplanes nepalensis TaxID=587533 RepID=A0ABT9MQN3_9ACTN|nr:helix-turn-helix transcriptional regulator [Catenuloplanes nepalensis]MDP9793371.1 transcriptional regulator with XRE-family HTH domain [Catenuloplanes nepalensis]